MSRCIKFQISNQLFFPFRTIVFRRSLGISLTFKSSDCKNIYLLPRFFNRRALLSLLFTLFTHTSKISMVACLFPLFGVIISGAYLLEPGFLLHYDLVVTSSHSTSDMFLSYSDYRHR